jgi:hypothetical protein
MFWQVRNRGRLLSITDVVGSNLRWQRAGRLSARTGSAEQQQLEAVSLLTFVGGQRTTELGS